MSRLSALDWHRIVLDTQPTLEQLKLYESWPKFKGISDRSQNVSIAEAVITLALSCGGSTTDVVMLAPQAVEEWMLQQIETVAVRCFEACPKRYPGRAREMINGFTVLFRKVKMTGRLLQMSAEPAHWVSFGFSADDTLPPWMQGRLLTVE